MKTEALKSFWSELGDVLDLHPGRPSDIPARQLWADLGRLIAEADEVEDEDEDEPKQLELGEGNPS
jgi:hypothetical protein